MPSTRSIVAVLVNVVVLAFAQPARADETIVYQNGFESADTCAWTSTVPYPSCDLEMVFVPAGEFSMGSNGGLANEQPLHTVALDAFWIDRTKVTVEAYAACVAHDDCLPPNADHAFDPACNYGDPERLDHPINCIDWFRAQSYCAWAGKRLPSEAEWEKASRGTEAREYPWGAQLPSCSYAVLYDEVSGKFGCGLERTAPVGSRPAGASPHGAHDMAGNVWEWVNDWYSGTYYSVSPAMNPPGPENGSARVLRGGSWLNQATTLLRAAYRNDTAPSTSSANVGFRCAQDG